MRVTYYAGPLDGAEGWIPDEPPRGELWSFASPPDWREEHYVYDCQGRFVYLRTATGKAIYASARATR